MKGTTNAQRNAIIDSTSAVDSLTLTKADGTTQKHTVSNIIPKDDVPTSGSSKFVTSGAIYTALDGKVSVVSGKGLSTNDYTTAEKSKVSNLPANANTTFATKTELTDALSSVYKYKGSVNTYNNLPSNATAGDVYNVVASYNGVPAGTNWAWNGSSWDALGGTVTGYVADTTTVNGKPLSSNITLTAADVTAVPTTRTVNGKALSGDITLAASDVGALASGGTAARATADASGNVITSTYATKSALETGLAGKQNSLTFDSAPTSGSSNPVTSGGVYSAINAKQDKLTFDETPTSGSSNLVTSNGIYNAINNGTTVEIEEYYAVRGNSENLSTILTAPYSITIGYTGSSTKNWYYTDIYRNTSIDSLYYDKQNNLIKRCKQYEDVWYAGTSFTTNYSGRYRMNDNYGLWAKQLLEDWLVGQRLNVSGSTSAYELCFRIGNGSSNTIITVPVMIKNNTITSIETEYEGEPRTAYYYCSGSNTFSGDVVVSFVYSTGSKLFPTLKSESSIPNSYVQITSL